MPEASGENVGYWRASAERLRRAVGGDEAAPTRIAAAAPWLIDCAELAHLTSAHPTCFQALGPAQALLFLLLVTLFKEELMSDVDGSLVTHFNLAASLGRDGEHAASLEAYRTIIAKALAGKRASKEFIATARMRIGFCLMDLKRFNDARAEFEAMKPLVGELGTDGQYEFHFAYGNTLGSLGLLDAMFTELVNAISLAEDMDDYSARPASCWANILNHGLKAKDWAFVEKKAEIALNNSRLRGMVALEAFAQEMIAKARKAKKRMN